jgi:hypothetical protein
MFCNADMKNFRRAAIVIVLAVLHALGTSYLLLCLAPHSARSGDDKIYSFPVLGMILLKIFWFPYLSIVQARWWPGSSRVANLALFSANSLLWGLVIYGIAAVVLKGTRLGSGRAAIK